MHGGVEGAGRSGCRGREWALRQRRRHRAVVAPDPRPRGVGHGERRRSPRWPARAKVGISALYRRYASKEDLLRELARDGLVRYIAELEGALADDRDPWTVYADCLTKILDGGNQALAQRLAGTFTPTPDLTARHTR